MAEDRLAALAATLGTGVAGVTRAGVEGGELVLRVDPPALLAVMGVLRDDPRFACEQAMDICGVDWPERRPRFEIVYNLLSVSLNHRIRVIVGTDEGIPIQSVSSLWPSATWWEREVWDLFGVTFAGLADHRRILTDYGFEGHPLRKDFPMTGHVEVRWDDERSQVVYEPVRLTQDFRNFQFLSPWEGITTLPGDEKAHASRVPPPAGGAP